MKLYLAGPMSGIEHHNTPAFDAAAYALRGLCFDVVSPPEITRANPQSGVHSDGSIDAGAYAELVRLDFAALLECDAVALLPGWQRSVGARREIALARWIGLDVYYAADLIINGLRAVPLTLAVSLVCIETSAPLDCAGGAAFDGDPARVLGQGAV